VLFDPETNPILKNLNTEQRTVVLTTEGPVLVLAGAGSGKTRCITHRVAYLVLNQHIKPWNILVVTFTNKAADELRERLQRDFPINIKAVTVGTFHSVCLKIIRYEIACFPEHNSHFTVYTRDDQVAFMKRIYKANDIDHKIIPIDKVLSVISKCKSKLILPDAYLDVYSKNEYSETYYKLYKLYFEQMKTENAMDFDDLLLNTALLLERNKEVLQKYQDIYKYIMVDEYQDTNTVQFRIVNLLAEKHHNICVVGDDDQAIYGWRGANIQNILTFHQDYPEVKIIKLERNYRSSQSILNLANRVIAANQSRHKKTMWTQEGDGAFPSLVTTEYDNEEVDYIARHILEKLQTGIHPQEIVVLYRTNAQSRIFEAMFANYGIPYQIVGSYGFFKRAVIKDMLAWLRFLVNPSDTQAALRIINVPPRNIGKTTLSLLLSYMEACGITILEALADSNSIPGLKPKATASLASFHALITNIQAVMQTLTLPEIVKYIVKVTKLLEYFEELAPTERLDKIDNINEFITATAEFDERFLAEEGRHPTISDYINTLSLQSDIDEYDGKRDTVKLMTLHCVKGLEFEVVFISGLEDGLLPHVFCFDKAIEIEEERRLLYVGITRAKSEVHLSYSNVRRVAGRYNYQMPSRFLKVLDSSVIEYKNEKLLEKSVVSHYKVGQLVSHTKHGRGVIKKIEGEGEKETLTIIFKNGNVETIKSRWVNHVF